MHKKRGFNYSRKWIYLKNKHIEYLPQTLHFYDNQKKEKCSEIFSQHNNITFFGRDSISFEIAKQMFPKASVFQCPDFVTSLIGRNRYEYERKGILVILRDDKEKLLSDACRQALISKLSQIDEVCVMDTTVNMSMREIRNDREKCVMDMVKYCAHFKTIVTDRYHGTIFSLVANTPVVVLNTIDFKVKAACDWFPDEYKDMFSFIDNVNDVENIVEKVREFHKIDEIPQLQDYFYRNYFLKLKDLIEK